MEALKLKNRTLRYHRVPLDNDLIKKARLLALAGDRTRIRILCFMFRFKKACVSDIARSLDLSIACVSHHLRVMRDNGFFTSERRGNNICYILAENNFIKNLENIICKTSIAAF